VLRLALVEVVVLILVFINITALCSFFIMLGVLTFVTL